MTYKICLVTLVVGRWSSYCFDCTNGNKSRQYSNKKAGFHPDFFGFHQALGQTRTGDRPLTRRLLYRLSYEGNS